MLREGFYNSSRTREAHEAVFAAERDVKGAGGTFFSTVQRKGPVKSGPDERCRLYAAARAG
jgi:hypothetical protein